MGAPVTDSRRLRRLRNRLGPLLRETDAAEGVLTAVLAVAERRVGTVGSAKGPRSAAERLGRETQRGRGRGDMRGRGRGDFRGRGGRRGRVRGTFDNDAYEDDPDRYETEYRHARAMRARGLSSRGGPMRCRGGVPYRGGRGAPAYHFSVETDDDDDDSLYD